MPPFLMDVFRINDRHLVHRPTIIDLIKPQVVVAELVLQPQPQRVDCNL